MGPGLIEQRHPALAALLRQWTAAEGRRDALSPAQFGDLAVGAVWITPGAPGAGPVLADCGAGVSRIYGAVLDGLSADVLTPGRGDGATEAAVAMTGGRPVLTENGGPERRLIRLYLPLTEVDGSCVSTLCGIVQVRMP